jgi:hypothetical protein
MSRRGPLFREVQRFPLRRVAVALFIPPLGMTCLLVWQVVLGHSWGKQPMPNGSVVFWSLFLWMIVSVWPTQVSFGMRPSGLG